MTTTTTRHEARRGLQQCAIAAVLFGAATPAASVLSDHLSAFTLAGLLYVGAALAMTPFLRRDRPDRSALRAGGARLSLAVLFGGMVGPLLLMLALDRAPSATVALLLNLEVVFTVLIAGIVFREHLGGRVIAGAAAVAVAGITLAWSNDVDLRLGALLAVGACASWAVDNSVTANLDVLRPQHITFAKGAVAGSVNLAIGLLTSHGFDALAALAALGVGAVGYGASITLWISGARQLGAARGQIVFAAAPFIGAVLSWVVLGDAVQARGVFAIAVAAAGISLVVRSGHTHRHRHERIEHEHEHRHDDGHHDHHHDHPVDSDTTRHTHRHVHDPVEHDHPHVPDLHHRHVH